jgi:hypothetical protein
MSAPTTLDPLESYPWREKETDESKIIQPHDVSDTTELRSYFMQRLGKSYNEVSFIQMSRETYLSLLHGEHAIISKMIMKDEASANEIFLAYAGDKQNSVIMTLNIEKPNTGEGAIAFIEEHKSCEDHVYLKEELQHLSVKMQQLHQVWKRNPFPYFKLPSTPKAQKIEPIPID